MPATGDLTMTTAYWCVLAAAMTPYLAVVLAKAQPGFDNHAPRPWLERQSGWRQRAYWAHQNCFEAFPLFAAAVIIAHLAQASQARIDALAVVFVLARLAYIAAYVADAAVLRSLVWTVGLLCVIGLFVVSV
jgi:uncharacterized MAPEG superfamily protein